MKKHIINLIKYHCSKNEEEFRKEAYRIVKIFDKQGYNQLAEFIIAQLSEVSTFQPGGGELDSNRTEFINNPPELVAKYMIATGIKTVADVYDDLSSEGATPFHFFAKLEEAIKNKKLVVYKSDELAIPVWVVSDDEEYWFYTSENKEDCERFVKIMMEK